MASENRTTFFGHRLPEIDVKARDLALVSISVGRQCNLKCKHCYSSSSQSKTEYLLPKEEWFEAIDQLRKIGCRIVCFTGGEPLLYMQKVLSLGAYSRSRGMQIGLVTNGTAITQEKAKQIQDLGFTVTVSLDGTETYHDSIRKKGTYAKAVKGIATLVENGVEAYILATLTMRNVDEVDHLVGIAGKLKVKQVMLNTLKPEGRAKELYSQAGLRGEDLKRLYKRVVDYAIKYLEGNQEVLVWTLCQPLLHPYMQLHFSEHYSRILNQLPPIFCRAGRFRLWISERGEVHPCAFIPLSIGNVVTDRLEKVWKRNTILIKISQRRFKGVCGGCSFNQVCGGCRAVAYFQKGDLLESDPTCILH